MTIFAITKPESLLGLDFSELLLLVCGILLTVGIVGEYAKSEKWKKLARTFAALVVIGVAGELVSDAGVFYFSRHLQAMADAKLAAVTREAGDAQISADRAAGAASRANSFAEQAEQHAIRANKKASRFQLEIARSNARAAEAEKRAAQAKLALEKLRSPRSISSREQNRMVKALAAFGGTPFDLTVGDTSESVNLMGTVQSILVRAGWRQVAAAGPIGLGSSKPLIGIGLNSGILVEISASRFVEWSPAVGALVHLLRLEHLNAKGTAALKGVRPDAVHITIGTKPLN